MEERFSSLEDCLVRLGRRRLIETMGEGLPIDQIRSQLAVEGLSSGRAVESLFSWRNGLPPDVMTIGEAYIFPGMYFLSLDSSLKVRRERLGWSEWSPTWLPIMEDGGTGLLIIDSEAGVSESPIWYFESGWDGVPIAFLSFESMLSTIIEGYERGIFFVDDSGVLEMNGCEFDYLAEEMNPGADYW